MEVSLVRKRLKQAIDAARERGQQRRQRTADAERAYAAFLQEVATPVTRKLANALKAERLAFTVFTPVGGLRLASDRGRSDYIEFGLATGSPAPEVVGRIMHTRGSRTLDEERPVKPGVGPEALTEEDVLSFLLDALEPWLER